MPAAAVGMAWLLNESLVKVGRAAVLEDEGTVVDGRLAELTEDWLIELRDSEGEVTEDEFAEEEITESERDGRERD